MIKVIGEINSGTNILNVLGRLIDSIPTGCVYMSHDIVMINSNKNTALIPGGSEIEFYSYNIIVTYSTINFTL